MYVSEPENVFIQAELGADSSLQGRHGKDSDFVSNDLAMFLL